MFRKLKNDQQKICILFAGKTPLTILLVLVFCFGCRPGADATKSANAPANSETATQKLGGDGEVSGSESGVDGKTVDSEKQDPESKLVEQNFTADPSGTKNRTSREQNSERPDRDVEGPGLGASKTRVSSESIELECGVRRE